MENEMEEEYFDNAPAHSAEGEATEKANTPEEHIPGNHKEIVFADPPKQDEPHPDAEEIAQLIANAVHPLEIAINEMNESLQDAIQQATQRPQSDSSPDAYNISSLQFQVAMLQPCNGQILPASVRDEIDRLYLVEKEYNIAKRAQKALILIVEHDPVMLNLPEDPDERLLIMELMNEWYTREHPKRKPLKISSAAS